MTSGASDLVMVMPTDTFDSIAKQIRASGAGVIQLLIADNNPAFQSADTFTRLAELVRRGRVQLMVISSDELTLAAAQGAGLDVVGVDGARISMPTPPQALPPEDTYKTHVIPREELDPPASRDEDSDLLAHLYSTAPPSAQRYPAPDSLDDDLDEDLDDGLDDGPRARQDRQHSRRDDLDDLDDLDDDYLPLGRRPLDEIEDVTPSRGSRAYGRRGSSQPSARQRGRRPIPAYADFDDDLPRQQRGSFVLPIILGILLVALLIGFGFYMNRPLVAFWPPSTNVKITPFSNEIIPIAESSADGSIQAQPISTRVEQTIQGTASQQPSPSGTARGTVQIINALNNPIDLPVGTEFIGTNSAGQQVGFLIDSPATVPAAISTSDLFGSRVEFGKIDIQVSARSPGSASNIAADSLTQMIVPGQPPISNSEQVRLINQPIEGGTEELLYIVTEQDVRNILGTGLGKLYQNAQTKLSAMPPQGLSLDPDTIWPNTTSLGDPENYDTPVITPTVGQPVDQANPVFTMTLSANFSALAAPKPIQLQMQSFLKSYFYQRSGTALCGNDSQFDVTPSRTVWNGQQLLVDGELTCTPKTAITTEMQAQVQRAVLGQSYSAAKANLDQLQSQGVIGSYQLPNVESFPSIGLLVGFEGHAGTYRPTQFPQGQLLPTAEPSAAAEPKATAEPEATAEPTVGAAQ